MANTRRSLSAAVVLIAVAGCHDPFPRPPSPEVRLFEKGIYQFLYDEADRPLRILTDADRNGVADTIELFDDRMLRRVERDTDADGVIDHWEEYRRTGELERVGTSQPGAGRPDEWAYLDGFGGVRMRQLDEDGDGRIDRVEHFDGGTLAGVSLDGDADGQFDRWQDWEAEELVAERFDTDSDGVPDRRVRFGRGGDVIAVERYP